MANEQPTTTYDWLSVTKEEMNNTNAPLGMLKEEPLSYFDVLTRNFTGGQNLFQVNLGQFPQNFVLTTGPGTKVEVLHSLSRVNVNPDEAGTTIVVGVYGAIKVAPFKSITASSAVLALNPPRQSSKKDANMLLLSLQQFDAVEGATEFAALVGEEEGTGVDQLSKLPNAHFIHLQVFVDIGGKREWEASQLGFELISLYTCRRRDHSEITRDLSTTHLPLGRGQAVRDSGHIERDSGDRRGHSSM
jgi:hypothetical protein